MMKLFWLSLGLGALVLCMLVVYIPLSNGYTPEVIAAQFGSVEKLADNPEGWDSTCASGLRSAADPNRCAVAGDTVFASGIDGIPARGIVDNINGKLTTICVGGLALPKNGCRELRDVKTPRVKVELTTPPADGMVNIIIGSGTLVSYGRNNFQVCTIQHVVLSEGSVTIKEAGKENILFTIPQKAFKKVSKTTDPMMCAPVQFKPSKVAPLKKYEGQIGSKFSTVLIDGTPVNLQVIPREQAIKAAGLAMSKFIPADHVYVSCIITQHCLTHGTSGAGVLDSDGNIVGVASNGSSSDEIGDMFVPFVP